MIFCKSFWSNHKKYTLEQRIIFLKQLHLILSSGISILKGVTILERKTDKRIKPVCNRLLIELQNGKPLAEAMNRNPDFFPSLVVTLTAAGEQSGELLHILNTLVDYYTNQKEFKAFLTQSLIYPLFLVGSALVVMLFFLMYVLPILATTYSAMQAQPSGFLKFALKLNTLLKEQFYWVIASLLLVSALIHSYLSQLQKLVLRISYFKHIHTLILEARFCKLLALLLNSGINIAEAVTIAGSTINNKQMLSKLQLVRNYLQRGIEMNAAIEHSQNFFSPITEELLIIGATTGYLPHMLEEAARIANEDLKHQLHKIKEFLAPTLLIMAGIITACIVCSVMSPLFELFTAIPEF